jgi:hypothetical protein
MFTSQRPTIPGNAAEEPASEDGDSAVSYYVGRLIQIAIAIWLLPALVIVLAVGGIGIVALKTSRMITRSVSQPPETQQFQSVHGEGSTVHGYETAAPKKPEQQGIGPIVDRATYHRPHHV